MADREVTVKIRVDADGAVQETEKLGDAIGDIPKQTDDAAAGLSKLKSGLGALAIGVGSVVALGAALNSLAQRGKELDDLTASFEFLASSVGSVADDKLQALREATQGTITDIDLMKAANSALILGVDDGSGVFEKAALSAVKLGKALGVDATNAIESLTTGIGRQSKLMLDNLGIIISVEKANESYAASINKTVAELTDQERKLAFNAEAFRKIEEAVQGLPEPTIDAATGFNQVGVEITNLIGEVGSLVNSSEALGSTLSALASVIGLVASAVETLAPLFSRTAKEMDILDQLAEGTRATFLGIPVPFTKASKAVQGMAQNLKGLSETIKQAKTQEQIQTLTVALNRLRTQAIDAGEGFDEFLFKQIERVSAELKVQSLAIAKGTDEIEDFGDANEEAGKKAKTLEEKIRDLVRAQVIPAGQGFKDLSKAINSVQDEFKRTGDIEAYEKSLEELIRIGLDAGLTLTEVSKAIAAVNKQAEEKPSTQFGGFFDELFNFEPGSADSIGGDLLNGIGSALKQGLNNGFGSDTAGSIVDSISGGLKQTGNPFAVAGGFALDLFGDDIISGVRDIFKGSKKDASANSREDFEGYLIDVFDAANATAVINGELIKLKDVVNFDRDFFDSDEGGQGFSFFNTLPDQARTAFEGVGVALSELLGDSENLGSQFGAELATGLGGSLFALKGAVDVLGFSFEELGAAVVDSAKKGELSFLEAESALRGIGLLAQDGIPGQLGAVKEAFDAIKVAGATGGATTIQAFKAVGFELQELGANTLPEIADKLTELGIEGEDAAKFMEALGEVGITSAEGIAEATDRLAIQALADLESQAFAFGEAAQDSAEKLIDRLENIPEEINSRIIVEVETVALDSGAQSLIDSGNFGPGLTA